MKVKVDGIQINYRIDGPQGAPRVTMSNSLATTHRMWDAQVEAVTKQYRVIPTLVVVGADDPATTVEMSRTIDQGIPGSELVILKGTAHLSNLEQPEAFNEAVLGFLKRH